LLTAGSPKPPAQPFSITEALKKFIGTASHPPSTSPSVVSIQDTDTDSTSPHTGYISSDDDPDADDAEFIPASASTGFLPVQFNQATLSTTTIQSTFQVTHLLLLTQLSSLSTDLKLTTSKPTNQTLPS
jgi:hypothetical protein